MTNVICMKLCLALGMIALSLTIIGTRSDAQAIDLELGYAARETRPTTDNDLFYLNTGLTWGGDRKLHRAEILAAVRNEDFSGSYPPQLQAEYTHIWIQPDTLTGIGARGNWSEDIESTGEFFLAYQTFWDRFSLRGLAGIQSTFGQVPGRDRFGGFLVAEASWYARENFVLRGGLQVDNDGEMLSLATEWRIGRSDYSIFAEAAFAPEDYRDLRNHDNLTVALRWTRGLRSFRDRDMMRADRQSHRYFAVQ